MRVAICGFLLVLLVGAAWGAVEVTVPLQFVDDWPPVVQPGLGFAVLPPEAPAAGLFAAGALPAGAVVRVAQVAVLAGKSVLVVEQRDAEGKLAGYFVDAAGAGTLTAADFLPIGALKLPAWGEARGVQVEVTLGADKRTLLLAPGPIRSLLAYRVRGYYAGLVSLGGAARQVALVDEDLDAAFNGSNDALLVDLAGSGELTDKDILPTRGIVSVAGTRYAVLAKADGSSVRFVERPTGTGTVRLVLPDKVTLTQAQVSLRFENGTAQTISPRMVDTNLPNGRQEHHLVSDGGPATVPAGMYYIASATFTAHGPGGDSTLSASGNSDVPALDGDPQRLITVNPGQEVALDLFSKCGLTLTADATTVAPGDSVTVTLQPHLAYGLTIVDAGQAQSTLITTGPDGQKVDQGSSGFG